MRTLLIDNHDSFTFNLFHLLGEVNGDEPIVVRNDELTWQELAALRPDNIVISPGPGRPERARDVGVSTAALEHAQVPVLGVCLGHQALAHVSGGTIRHAPEVMHGRTSAIHHDGLGLFAGMPQGFDAVRYHSLVVGIVPADLRVTAWTLDHVVMGLEHRARPLWGVQFHPESICTEHGRTLARNFRDLTHARRRAPRPVPRHTRRPASAVRIHHRTLERWCDPESAFVALYGGREHAVWLDSSLAEPGLARFSFMGAPEGPLGQVVRYDVATGELTVQRAGKLVRSHEHVLDYCERELARLRADAPELPLNFTGGFAGYLGYELKGGEGVHRSALPDAALVFCDRLIAFDHERRRVHLLALAAGDGEAAARAWLASTERELLDAPDAPPPTPPTAGALSFTPREDRDTYLANIDACLHEIFEGETYEVCLTTELYSDGAIDALAAYRALRARNPAPYAALLRLGDVSVLSSSPERFLRVDRERSVESKPIKGTARRGLYPTEDAYRAAALRADEKSRAENLMIVDLVRNDLGRVCELGSVEVPALMAVESYATVHQLVTTVRGRLREDASAIDCIRAAFPGGSMTGAPKQRTLEIIDRLEAGPRGVYSGVLGFLSVNGTADLSIVIRTLVASPDGLRIGSGGAIVAGSDPDDEHDEMLLKARAVLEAVGGTLAAGPQLAGATH
ncbi:aminodeoxychorismate synthase component I [Solirubrobacter ginsenosidimutans]|uniref:aminodeoxychorismate synthase n=1 Tax=Solirubrobacter ginsenosidimutans TaxID=490573 RepID=A0A9X3RYR2_9ACTN|nr:aminodeoxychorismate synthase component I [Solirubrobacter ginsenosidimutans]MDA0159975.1 aminodeoxychorismate synthase component I [Solirubrobacter ginsenosidimutans]